MEMLAACGLIVTIGSVFCVGFFALVQLWIGEEIGLGGGQ